MKVWGARALPATLLASAPDKLGGRSIELPSEEDADWILSPPHGRCEDGFPRFLDGRAVPGRLGGSTLLAAGSLGASTQRTTRVTRADDMVRAGS